jgi:C-terminal processing protease CtpA/Prc
MKKQKTIIIVLFVSMGFCSASAQDITATERSEIIDNVVDQLVNRYVDPNLGQKAAETIMQKKEKQAYDALDTKASLMKTLTADMLEATRDKQLQLNNQSGAGSGSIPSYITIKTPNGIKLDDQQQKKIMQQMLKLVNYGLINAKVLEGNIGFLEIREFFSPGMVPEINKAIDNTMKSFKDCSAIILDLRFCSADGASETVMYMISYLFGGEESVLLYELYNREEKKINEFRTRTDVTGKRLPDVPVYILTSSKTFSSGEMFAYGLQKIGRAKIVGETSAGAAHETDTVDIGHDVMMVVPINRLAHVKTKIDWEGTGVIPDVSAKADEALDVAKDIIQKAKQNDK